MIISCSGRIGSGKDTVGSIIQYLITTSKFETNGEHIKGVATSLKDFLDYKDSYKYKVSGFKIKKFADKLKDIVCLLTGCTREQLEDQEFKNSKLPIEWEDIEHGDVPHGDIITYRDLLQYIGTDLFRSNLHQNVWVNSLMNEYKKNELSHYKLRESGREYFDEDPIYKHPNWIITDMRFPNEMKAVKDRGGITIRVTRNNNPCVCVDDSRLDCLVKCNKKPEHESEIALDYAIFDYEIDNSGSVEELLEKVRQILITEKML